MFVGVLLALVFAPQESTAGSTYLEYDQIDWSAHKPAQKQLTEGLKKLGAKAAAGWVFSEFNLFQYKESIYQISSLRKPKLTLVYIHGLYGGADQFRSFDQHMISSGSNASAILLTLPGHYIKGTIGQPVVNATKQEWTKAVMLTMHTRSAFLPICWEWKPRRASRFRWAVKSLSWLGKFFRKEFLLRRKG